MSRLVGIGAGGHGAVVLDAILAAGVHEVVCVLDRDPARVGTSLLGVPVRHDDELEAVLAGVDGAFVGVGGVGDLAPRERVLERLEALGVDLPAIVHPAAIVAASAQVGPGAQVLARAVVNPRAQVGAGAIVNTGAIVEHDCCVGRCAHVAPAAALAGDVTVGARAHVGLNASVVQGLRIGVGALVGAGAVVVRDVPDGATVVGVPARERPAARGR